MHAYMHTCMCASIHAVIRECILIWVFFRTYITFSRAHLHTYLELPAHVRTYARTHIGTHKRTLSLCSNILSLYDVPGTHTGQSVVVDDFIHQASQLFYKHPHTLLKSVRLETINIVNTSDE